MGTAKFTFIRTVIHNSFIGGVFNKGDRETQPLQWKPDPKYLWFTSPKERVTGWNQEGLDFFVNHCKLDEADRVLWKTKYKNKEERPHYFDYEELKSDTKEIIVEHRKNEKTLVVPGKEVYEAAKRKLGHT
eukprot:2562270-Ditylum_brightwellii.AAC.1